MLRIRSLFCDCEEAKRLGQSGAASVTESLDGGVVCTHCRKVLVTPRPTWIEAANALKRPSTEIPVKTGLCLHPQLNDEGVCCNCGAPTRPRDYYTIEWPSGGVVNTSRAMDLLDEQYEQSRRNAAEASLSFARQMVMEANLRRATLITSTSVPNYMKVDLNAPIDYAVPIKFPGVGDKPAYGVNFCSVCGSTVTIDDNGNLWCPQCDVMASVHMPVQANNVPVQGPITATLHADLFTNNKADFSLVVEKNTSGAVDCTCGYYGPATRLSGGTLICCPSCGRIS